MQSENRNYTKLPFHPTVIKLWHCPGRHWQWELQKHESSYERKREKKGKKTGIMKKVKTSYQVLYRQTIRSNHYKVMSYERWHNENNRYWLGYGVATTRSVIRLPHNNRAVVGFIGLKRGDKETTLTSSASKCKAITAHQEKKNIQPSLNTLHSIISRQ